MITYDPGYLGVAMTFQLAGSVFPKAMVWAVPCTIVAAVLHYLLSEYPDLSETLGVGDSAASVFGGFNFILGFLVVFRSQQAYARWWEGGTLLQQLRGEWCNAFSCLVAFCNAGPEKRADVAQFQQQMVRLFSLLHGSALMQVSQSKSNHFALINMDGFDDESLRFLQECPDKCVVTLQWIQRLMVESEQKQILKIPPPILSRVYNELGNGIVNLNNARKIKDFPIPFPLVQMNMVMLIFHAIFTPLICAATVTKLTWAALLTFVLTFSFWCVMYIAMELEMPYGEDANDLPLRDMAVVMNDSLLKMLHPTTQKVPEFNMSGIPGFDPETGKLPANSLVTLDVNMDEDISVVGRSAKYRPSAPAKPAEAAAKPPRATDPGPSPEMHEALHPFGANSSSAGEGKSGSEPARPPHDRQDAPVIVPVAAPSPVSAPPERIKAENLPVDQGRENQGSGSPQDAQALPQPPLTLLVSQQAPSAPPERDQQPAAAAAPPERDQLPP